MSRTIIEHAHAKINLTLEALRRRSDGYHDLATVIMTVTLADTLKITPHKDLVLDGDTVTENLEDNFAYKAASALRKLYKVDEGARITIEKRIPVSSGMGGGSADAAAVLRALNRLWKINIGYRQLARIGETIGSDVPFLVHEGAALVQGRGEKTDFIKRPRIGYLVIVSPNSGRYNKTADMFGRITTDMFTKGSLSHKLAARIQGGGDCPSALMFNIFSGIAPTVFKDWRESAEGFFRLGADEVMLTGAGPSIFAIPPTKEMGTAWQLLLERSLGIPAFLVKPWMPADENKVRDE